MFDVLDDSKVDDGQGNSSNDWGYGGDKYLRPNQDRYWFRMKHDQQLPEGFFARLDLDIVSDQDYLREFKSSFGGFNDSDEYFLGEFGRDLDEYNDPVRVNSLNVSKYWNLYSLNAEARWYDDVNKRRHSDTDDTLQKLPYVSFAGLRQPVLGSPFVFDLESEYTYFFREDSFTGHRADIAPRLYLPLRFLEVLAVEPSVGVRETIWYIDDWDDYKDEKRKIVQPRIAGRAARFIHRVGPVLQGGFRNNRQRQAQHQAPDRVRIHHPLPTRTTFRNSTKSTESTRRASSPIPSPTPFRRDTSCRRERRNRASERTGDPIPRRSPPMAISPSDGSRSNRDTTLTKRRKTVRSRRLPRNWISHWQDVSCWRTRSPGTPTTIGSKDATQR